ncbi:MAG: carboxypeptidase-like regulatory domain-containing protein [Chloroflexota bacterium]
MTAFLRLVGGILHITFLVLLMAGCAGGGVGVSPTPSGGIGGTVTAGPICPVEKVPPDPACAARPVGGAVLIVREGSDGEVARATTSADGTFFIALPPGSYVVAPQDVEGFLGGAQEQSVEVAAGARSDIVLVYDTGIRGPVSAP